MKSESIVSVRGITKRFGSVTALDCINIDFEHGVTGLVGPNGAGKTTLIKILLGLLFADEGHAEVLGQDVTKESLQIRQKTGVLHERPNYPGYMRLGDYLFHVAKLYADPMDSCDVLDLLGLYEARKKKIRELSGGMLRRLGVAQAIIGNPQIAFLDEPTANLDVDGRNDVINLLGELSRSRSLNLILSSHILTELERICDSIAFIKKGQIVKQGQISKVIADYSHNRYKVVCSDSSRFAEALRNKDGFSSVQVSGTRQVFFTYNGKGTTDVWEIVVALCKEVGISVDGLVKSEGLEDAYRGIMN